jgi:hypothetical protein
MNIQYDYVTFLLINNIHITIRQTVLCFKPFVCLQGSYPRQLQLSTRMKLNICRNIKEEEVGGTCGTHGGGERCLQDFGWEARR